MLSKKVLKGVVPLARRINSKGLALESIANTPVDNLVSTTNVVADTGELRVEETSELSSKDGLLPNGHNTELDCLVECGKTAVAKLLMTTRNVIIPAQQELLDSCKGLLEESINSNLAGYSVEVDVVNPVFRDGNFLSLVEEFKNSKQVPSTRILKFGSKLSSEVVSFLNTGFAGTDECIAMWVAAKGESWFGKVWSDFFNNEINSDQRDFSFKVTSDPDKALAVFLISRYLLENTLPDTGLSLSEYVAEMTKLRNVSGYILCSQLNNLDNLLKGGILVSRIDGTVIWVLEDTYKTWLEQGGTAELLLGVLVSGAKYEVTGAGVLANRERYQKAWNDFVKLSNSNALANRYNNLRSQLTKAYLDQLEADESITGERDRATYFKDFKVALQRTTDTELQDLPKAVVTLLCKTRYKNEDALFILDRICFHCKAQPDLTAEEASALATIEYVTDWVVSQLKVKALGNGR